METIPDTDPGHINFPQQKNTMSDEQQLNAEDQARVDKFVSEGINSVPRKPFRPLRLLMVLIAVVSALTVFSLWLATFVEPY